MVLHNHSQVPTGPSFFHIAYLAATAVGPKAKTPLIAALVIGLIALKGKSTIARIAAGLSLGFIVVGGMLFILGGGLS